MRVLWLIGAIAIAPALTAAHAAEKTPTLGVGDISCSKEIGEALCEKLTERLVTALGARSPHPVERQAEARKKQRACKQDPTCMLAHRRTYEQIVSGTVRGSDTGVEISLRLLDARRMEKIAEASGHARTATEQDLLAEVEAAAARLFPDRD